MIYHQFRRPVRSRIEVRTAQNVVPMANHCAPEAMEKRTGVRVRRVPYRAPVMRPGIAGRVRHVHSEGRQEALCACLIGRSEEDEHVGWL